MYVEAICPLCFAAHVVPAEMRGEKYRCDECEEVFIVNKKSRKTSKRPPRPRTVRPADELDEVTPADAPDVLPLAKGALAGRRRADESRAGRPGNRRARRPGTPAGLIV